MKTSYIFIAGGIGITPFRSIIKSLVDEKDKQEISLFYLVSSQKEILFGDLLTVAQKEIGLNVEYVIGKRLTISMLKKQHAHLADYYYYLSGPQGMVQTYREMLMHEGVSIENIKMDSFTGYEK